MLRHVLSVLFFLVMPRAGAQDFYHEAIEEARARLRDARELFIDARDGYERGLMEMVEEKLEWQLQDDEEGIPVRASEIRAKMHKVREARLRLQFERAEQRVRLARSRMDCAVLEQALRSLDTLMGSLKNLGMEGELAALAPIRKALAARLQAAQQTFAYYEAKIEGNEAKAAEIYKQMKEKPPPPAKVTPPKID